MRAVFRKLDETGQDAVIGPMVECFSEYLPVPSADPLPVERLDDLLRQYPYFESTPLIILNSDGRYTLTGSSKSDSLFERFNIKRDWWALLKPLPESSRHKTPILRHSKNSYRKNSHSVSVPVSGEIMLPFLHFVYTENFFGKIERARKWKSHAGSASKYDYYGQLVDRIAAGSHSLLEETSIRYSSPQDLIDTGHMLWPENE